MSDVCCEISEIKERVEQDLSGYFQSMSSGEFAGQPVYPDDIKELVSIFLAISANHEAKDVINAFDSIENKAVLAEKYGCAIFEISKDDYLKTQISGLVMALEIPRENLNFN